MILPPRDTKYAAHREVTAAHASGLFPRWHQPTTQGLREATMRIYHIHHVRPTHLFHRPIR